MLFAVVAALGAWRSAVALSGSRRAGLVAAAALAFAPYRLFDAHGRSAIGEVVAIAVLPWLLLPFVRVLRGRRGGIPALAAAAAALVLGHLLSVVLAGYALAAWLVAELVMRRGHRLRGSGAALARLAAAALVAGGLTACFLLPLAADLRATAVGRIVAPAGRFKSPGVTLADWLGATRDPAEALRYPARRRASIQRHYQRQPLLPFGVTLLAGLLACALQAVRAGRAGRRLRGGTLAAAGVALAISLDALHPLTGWLPGLRALQFSWRALGVASVAAALAAGLAAAGTSRDPPGVRRALALALFAAVVVEGWRYASVPRWLEPWSTTSAVVPVAGRPGWFVAQPPSRRPPRRVTGSWVPPARPGSALRTGLAEAYIEYSRPEVFALRRVAWPRLGAGLGARIDGARVPLPAAPYARWTGPRGASRALRATAMGGHIRVRAPSRPGIVEVLEQCFPGWQERRGGAWWPAHCAPSGFLAATTGGRRLVEWRFDPWRWPRRLGLLISAATLLALLARNRHDRHRPPAA